MPFKHAVAKFLHIEREQKLTTAGNIIHVTFEI